MGEMNRRTVILTFLVALPTFAVIGPRYPSIQNPTLVARQTASTPRPKLGEVPPPIDLTSGTDQEAWFGRIRQHLLDLGAVYMRLERWNGVCPVYQFRCDLRQGPPSGHQTSIEAFSGSAEAAADYVLLAARRWSSQSHPARGSLRLFPATEESSTQIRSEFGIPYGRLGSSRAADGEPNPGLTRGQPLN
jgi:hypothetical protein